MSKNTLANLWAISIILAFAIGFFLAWAIWLDSLPPELAAVLGGSVGLLTGVILILLFKWSRR